MYLYGLQKLVWVSCFLIAFAGLLGLADAAAQSPQLERNLRSGFAMAQACEKEIDDDMTFYGECIGHAADRVAGQRRVLLGLHFQAWLMADLAARQNSTHALALRTQHVQGLAKQMKATKISWSQLCSAKQMRCELVKERLAQSLR
jgi:hypothetical protein